jgi:hypothetical protein
MPVLSATLAAAFATALQTAPVTPPPPRQTKETPPTALGDVVVDGRPLGERVREFVGEVAAPARRRGIARWRSRICFGVVNLRQAQARRLIDRVSAVATDYGVGLAEPGCPPNVVIVFADDGRAMADALVEADRSAFHIGVGGLDRGEAALRRFRESDAPVRWWHVSMPIVGATGQRAIRMPGDSGPIFVPGEGLVNRGRPITDVLNKVIVIVDMGKVEAVSFAQLADYLALVSLAQVDPEGDTAAYDSVLNLFDAPTGADGLTAWDRGYLEALYDSWAERLWSGEIGRAC